MNTDTIRVTRENIRENIDRINEILTEHHRNGNDNILDEAVEFLTKHYRKIHIAIDRSYTDNIFSVGRFNCEIDTITRINMDDIDCVKHSVYLTVHFSDNKRKLSNFDKPFIELIKFYDDPIKCYHIIEMLLFRLM